MSSHKTDVSQKHKREPLEDADEEFDHLSEGKAFHKSRVECICPGCGKMHVMKMHWIGRGVPRKFCESCRNRETPLGDEDN